MLFILLAFLSLTVPSFAQDTNGTTDVLDTKDDLGWWTVAVDRSISYSDNGSQFIEDGTKLAMTHGISFPSAAQLGNLKGFKGLWWVLWDEINGHWTKSILRYSRITQTVKYLSLDYALCGNSTITISLQSEVIAKINNTLVDGSKTTFICDGQMKQSGFKLGGTYSITLELNVYSSGKDGTDDLGFALVDKITTTNDPFATPAPRPNTTHHTWITAKTTTPSVIQTTTENSDGGAAFARFHPILCTMNLILILAAILLNVSTS